MRDTVQRRGRNGGGAVRPGVVGRPAAGAAPEPETARPAQAAPGQAARILLIEDEPGIVDFVTRGLRAAGFSVHAVLDGAEGERTALEGSFDAVVLDILLPSRNGLEVLASLRRSRPTLPVIVLSALDELEHRVAGLDAGAVDYVGKPFSVAELVARLRAQLRAIDRVSSAALAVGDIRVDLLTRRVTRAGEPVRLSTTELELLIYMMRHRGQVRSREQILGAVWGYEHDPGTNIVDVYVGYLRRKLGRPHSPAPIHTVRSVGYRLGTGANG
ncbi:MAG: response regulator transcription factor [Solirubrobacteraceae bacterium]